MDVRFHSFSSDVSSVVLPASFTFPFNYIPHPLCIVAKEEVYAFIEADESLRKAFDSGKMIGVLVVQCGDLLGYLVAYSGNLVCNGYETYFVPAIYNLLDENEFFKKEERNISKINAQIAEFENNSGFVELKNRLETTKNEAKERLAQEKISLKNNKAKRDELRATNLTQEEKDLLVAESQFQKAEFKRLSNLYKERIERLECELDSYTDKVRLLREERKKRSVVLQNKIFRKFRILSSQGEERDLTEIFSHTAQRIPPSGAGECAAPRLLQYAFKNGYKPIAMAEFWWGTSPKGEIRIHGQYYPACIGKCRPILEHQLKGMNVEEDPMLSYGKMHFSLPIVYEDEWLMVVNKPAGMLSVRGKLAIDSVEDRVAKLIVRDDCQPQVVHRLDMQTSGLLMIAKDKDTHKVMQRMFKERKVKKRYLAIVCRDDIAEEGEISLPLSPDYNNRPRQMVDFDRGKSAVTKFKVARRKDGKALVYFYPQTGRTHQIRIHAAHPLGLNAPILGDELYGQKSNRLYLHAEVLEFVHPHTGKEIRIECAADFV